MNDKTTYRITYFKDEEVDFIEVEARTINAAIEKFKVFGATIIKVEDINFDY